MSGREIRRSAIRRFNLAIGAIVALAILGFVWSLVVRTRPGPAAGALVPMVSIVSGFVLLIAAFAVMANWNPILDWFRVRVPKVIHDDVLGELAYRDGVWTARPAHGPSFWIMGRRTGPDPELVRAGSQAFGNVVALEATARAFVRNSAFASEPIGPVHSICARRIEKPARVDVVLEFSLTDSSDVLDVYFHDGEPVEIDVH